MITLDEIMKVLADYEPYEVFDIDKNITYSEEEAETLVWHEYEVKKIFSLGEYKEDLSYTVLEVKKIC